MKALYLFCTDLKKDHVASHVFEQIQKLALFAPTEVIIDTFPVLKFTNTQGHEFYLAQTSEVVSHEYNKYVPLLNQYFPDVNLAVTVNWHEGANAPEQVLTVHSTADVPSGTFGNTNPRLMRNLLLAIEANRKQLGLADFTTVTEATHWSGVLYPQSGSVDLIPQYPVPMFDAEIGSSPESWQNSAAAEVMARGLLAVFDRQEETVKSLLCLGGVHFEPSFVQAVLQTEQSYPLSVSHILPNQWLVSGNYEGEEGLEKLERCVQTIQGGIDAIVFHENLKGPIKDAARQLGQKLHIPVFKHKALREPFGLGLFEAKE